MKDKEYNHILNALIINSILIPLEDSINVQALRYNCAMVDVHTKMKPGSFRSQLQAVLTAFYDDIKGVQGASGCPKTKIIKRRFEDREDAGTTPKDETSMSGTVTAPAAAAPPQAGRSLKLRLRLLNLSPAQPYRRRDGVLEA